MRQMDLRTSPDRPAQIRALAWSVFNALQLVFTLLWTAGCISLALLVRVLSGRDEPALRMASTLWAPGLLGGAGANVVVEGAEAIDWSKPYFIVSNHQSIIDICALFRAVPAPLRFLLSKETMQWPFVGWYARSLGMPFIDRHHPRAAPAALREAAQCVRNGLSLCLFPEGTRSRDGSVGPFKAAPFQAAIDAGLQVLPVALEGTGEVLPAEGIFAVRPGTIRVRFGQPIVASETSGGRQVLAKQAHDAVLALLARSPGS